MAEEDPLDVKIEVDLENRFQSGEFQQIDETGENHLSMEIFVEDPLSIIKDEHPEEYCMSSEFSKSSTQDNSQVRNEDQNSSTIHCCLICGSITTTNEFSREKWMKTGKWREDCAGTISYLFLNSEFHHLNHFFEIAHYCSPCQKLIWDADFTRRKISVLEKIIDRLSVSLRKRFTLHFSELERNTNNVGSTRSTNDELIGNISFDEVVKIIYAENSSAFDLDALLEKDLSFPLCNNQYTINNVITPILKNKKVAKRPVKKSERRKPGSKVDISKETTDDFANATNGLVSNTDLNISEKPSTTTKKGRGHPKMNKTKKKLVKKTLKIQSPKKVGRPLKTNGTDKADESKISETNSTVLRTHDEDSNTSVENFEMVDQEISPESPAEASSQDATFNPKSRSGRRLKPTKRLMIEDASSIASRASEDLDEDPPKVEPRKKSKHGMRKDEDDESDYVPEEGHNQTDHERWLRRKAKERFKRRHANRYFPCPIEGCDMKYKENSTLQGHIRRVHEGIKDIYHCDFCPKTFHTKEMMKRHAVTHPESNIKVDDPGYVKPIYEFTCQTCGQGYHQKEDLSAHNKIHTGPNPFVCCHCKKECTNAVMLKAHIMKEHDEATPTCEMCGKSFSSNYSLKKHRKMHLNPEECLQCEECPYICTTAQSLRLHVNRHHVAAEAVQCETCGKTLKSSLDLKQHMKIHTGEKKRHQCRICEKIFASYASRNRHEEIHSGIRTHVCSFCGKALTTAANLKVHELIHTRDPNIPLPKRIYKKPFPKKKPKVKPTIDNITTNISS